MCLKQDFAIEDVLYEYDTDKDGFISLSEFIGDTRSDGKIILKLHSIVACFAVPSCHPLSIADLPTEEIASQWEIEETVRFKDLYDQDKDGKLNREEQLRWVAPNSYGSAREEVRLNLFPHT